MMFAPDAGVTVNVIGAASVTLAASPNPVPAGTATTLTATLPATTLAQSFTFTFDDGTAPVTQTGNSVPHVFGSAGTHTAGVTVQLVGGGTATAFTSVTVQ